MAIFEKGASCGKHMTSPWDEKPEKNHQALMDENRSPPFKLSSETSMGNRDHPITPLFLLLCITTDAHSNKTIAANIGSKIGVCPFFQLLHTDSEQTMPSKLPMELFSFHISIPLRIPSTARGKLMFEGPTLTTRSPEFSAPTTKSA
ncbi:cyclic AMP-dependent transcription factor ATF-2 [Striga asiatica]|uniref:Cyclic AMP-dependent transcription factor ATF-2 n=1 Tax=Striga asiatica TaxID=4170 RepID=A0A5A7RBK4_STRAF|nr:cyclic AMP-dependent transcription factor ATF-2 [Striga asiatica]